MTTRCNAETAAPRSGEDWLVSHNKGFRANIIVWGMPKDLPMLEIRAKLADGVKVKSRPIECFNRMSL